MVIKSPTALHAVFSTSHVTSNIGISTFLEITSVLSFLTFSLTTATAGSKCTNHKDVLCLSSYPPAQYFCSAHYRIHTRTQNAPGERSGRGRVRKRNQGLSGRLRRPEGNLYSLHEDDQEGVQYSPYEDNHWHHEKQLGSYKHPLDDKSYRSIQLKTVKRFAQRPSIP